MTEETCIVCSDAADDSNSSYCLFCRQRFHLNQRNDQPGKDCGDVWISEESLALEFGCASCIEQMAAGVSAPGSANA